MEIIYLILLVLGYLCVNAMHEYWIKCDDAKFNDLIYDIIKDFKANGENLKKLKIVDDGGNSISLDKLTIGKNYSLSYVFGKYHPVKRDIHSGNREHGDRRISLRKNSFLFIIKKGVLEKYFNVFRIKFGVAFVTDTKTFANLDGTQSHMFNEKNDGYFISGRKSNKLFDYFIEEFNIQYPELNTSKYKGSMSIRDIEKGVKPTIKFIDIFNKYGEEVLYSLRLGDNEREITKLMYNTRKVDWDARCKEEQVKLYEPAQKKANEAKDAMSKKVSNILKSNHIELQATEWEKYGFRNIFSPYDMTVEFRSTDAEISNKIDKCAKELDGIDGYILKNKRLSTGYSATDDAKYVLLNFEKE